MRTVASKTFILLLAHVRPRSFLSGELVELDRVLSEPNRGEFHHCYPRARLSADGFDDSQINVLANIAMITRSENRTISDKLPSQYRALMPDDAEEILAAAQVPVCLFDDSYLEFVAERAELLAARASSLIG